MMRGAATARSERANSTRGSPSGGVSVFKRKRHSQEEDPNRQPILVVNVDIGRLLCRLTRLGDGAHDTLKVYKEDPASINQAARDFIWRNGLRESECLTELISKIEESLRGPSDFSGSNLFGSPHASLNGRDVPYQASESLLRSNPFSSKPIAEQSVEDDPKKILSFGPSPTKQAKNRHRHYWN